MFSQSDRNYIAVRQTFSLLFVFQKRTHTEENVLIGAKLSSTFSISIALIAYYTSISKYNIFLRLVSYFVKLNYYMEFYVHSIKILLI